MREQVAIIDGEVIKVDELIDDCLPENGPIQSKSEVQTLCFIPSQSRFCDLAVKIHCLVFKSKTRISKFLPPIATRSS